MKINQWLPGERPREKLLARGAASLSDAELLAIFLRIGVSGKSAVELARELLREKGTPYAELGLGDAKWSEDELLDFMVQHPILMNRPVVVTPLGAKLCRPSEAVLDILPDPQRAAFSKEDGEAVVNAQGQRV